MNVTFKQSIIALSLLAPWVIGAVTVQGPVTATSGVQVNGTASKQGGTFVIDHPLDPRNKLLYHSFIESPDAKNLYDGIATLDGRGEVIIELPAYFMALNTDFRYQFFAMDEPMPNLHLQEEIYDNRFAIGGGVHQGRVSWQVTGVRHDPYILANPIIPEVEKGPGKLVKRGECLFKPLCL